jgi:hypothetical protein
MSVEALSTTTLAEALDDKNNLFRVASTTNISVDDYLVCRAEAMKVREVRSGNWISVVRGVNGTKSKPQKNGQRFFIGSPGKFQAIRDSLTSLVGDSGTYPEFLLPGQRAVDAAGNEYVLLDLTTQCYSGTTVLISGDGLFTAAPLVGGSAGAVAVTISAGTSDQYVWGQIYGYNDYAQESTGTSEVTSEYFPIAATSVSSPDVGMTAVGLSETYYYQINSMFITGDASTLTTSATSSTGVSVPVFLNYPYVSGWGAATQTTGGA